MSVIERWKRLTCPHCGDIWSADLADDNPYECAYCGKTGVGVVVGIVRDDQLAGAVGALQMIAAVVNDESQRPTTRVKASRGLVNDALARLGGQS
jgi:hypothetical protein